MDTNNHNRKTHRVRNTIVGAGVVVAAAAAGLFIYDKAKDDGSIAEQNAASRSAIEAENKNIAERNAEAIEKCLPITALAVQTDFNATVEGKSDVADIISAFNGPEGDKQAQIAMDFCTKDAAGEVVASNVDVSVILNDGAYTATVVNG